MDRAKASSPRRAVRDHDDDTKRDLLLEYDTADFRGRHELLDREGITVRDIARWRRETALRMTADQGTNGKRRGTLRPAEESVAALEAVDAAPRNVSTLPALDGPGDEAPRAADPEPAEEPSAGPRPQVFTATRERSRRQTAGESTEQALRHAAEVHLNEIEHHLDALETMAAQPNWQTIVAKVAAAGVADDLDAARAAVESLRIALRRYGDDVIAPAPTPQARARRDHGPWWSSDVADPEQEQPAR